MKAVTIGTAGDVLPTGEIWAFNAFQDHPSRPSDRLFQLHPWEVLPGDECDRVLEWPGPGPIYTVEDLRGKNSLAQLYPLAEIEAALGKGPWCSSVDYMLALAIYEGFDRILVSRFDVQVGALRERLMEHVSSSYWTGFARGRGIMVEHGGHLLRFPHRYGFEFQVERTFGQRLAFWAALAMLKFQYFDDGAAVTPVQGWESELSDRKIRVSI